MDGRGGPSQQGGLSVGHILNSPRIYLLGFTMGRGPEECPEALRLRNTRWPRHRSRI